MVVWKRCVNSVIRQLINNQNPQINSAKYTTHVRSLLNQGQFANPGRTLPLPPINQFLQRFGISGTRNLLDTSMVPVSSPLSGENLKTEKQTGPSKSRVQAIKKEIRMSPKKLNLVATMVRGMRVEDALLQLQVSIKRAAKTVYQVIHSARANASHNHGLDPDRLIVDEAFVGKGIYLKRLSIHAKGRSGIMVRPKCRLTVIVREITQEEEAKLAKLRVMNYKKLTRKEKRLMPHQLIEVSPRWARTKKEESVSA
ncbi:hypothetical protein LUZ60_008985 [Juncus effusus]|nr:hypothetical protein LUZ60_008985 [Juncus effusus]